MELSKTETERLSNTEMHNRHLSFRVNTAINIARYFETENVKIQLFRKNPTDSRDITGNELFVENCKKDIENIKLERKGQRYANAQSIMKTPFANPDTKPGEFETLLRDKFKSENSVVEKFYAFSVYAKHQLNYSEKSQWDGRILSNQDYWSEYYYLFPILDLWVDFLKKVAAGSVIVNRDAITAPEPKTLVTIPQTAPCDTKPSCKQYALYYYFLWQSSEIEGFNAGGRSEWLKQKSIENNISLQNLKVHFAKILNDNKRCKATAPNVTNLKKVSSMLAEYPKALKLASVALKSAKDGQR